MPATVNTVDGAMAIMTVEAQATVQSTPMQAECDRSLGADRVIPEGAAMQSGRGGAQVGTDRSVGAVTVADFEFVVVAKSELESLLAKAGKAPARENPLREPVRQLAALNDPTQAGRIKVADLTEAKHTMMRLRQAAKKEKVAIRARRQDLMVYFWLDAEKQAELARAAANPTPAAPVATATTETVGEGTDNEQVVLEPEVVAAGGGRRNR